jgi:hypothetical protein
VEFDREKYGRRLLVDAAPFHALADFITTSHPHRLRFYEILFLTGGNGFVDLDGVSTEVRPRRCASRRRERFAGGASTRRRRGTRYCSTATSSGSSSAMRDCWTSSLFFGNPGACAFLDLDAPEFTRVLSIVEAMHRELSAPCDVSDHCLRALLYQLLVEVGRHRPPSPAERRASGVRFPRDSMRW